MSIAFNDSTTLRGLVQLYEREIGTNRGVVTGDTQLLKEFTADANEALDDALVIALEASGAWQFDDSNHTDYPIITTNLVSGQRSYTFTIDENSNVILEIYKVMVADSSGDFHEIKPIDVQSEADTSTFYDGNDSSGVPGRYDKTANAVFLDPVPNYNSIGGLKVYINREASYFAYTDTTKKPGFPGIFHKYFYLRPALGFARRNSLVSEPKLQGEVLLIEQNMREYFGRRARDERWRMIPNYQNNR